MSRIVYARGADIDLNEIWNDNAERYNIDHADKYHHFLIEKLDSLSEQPGLGLSIEKFPHLRYFTVQRRAGGHGHIVIYERLEDGIRIIRIFHSSMDFISHLHSYEDW